MTEQGEVLSAKYSVAEIAHRELELTASAVLVRSLDDAAPIEPEREAAFDAVVERMAEALRRAPTARSSTTTRSFVGVLPRGHAGRRDLAAAARLAAGRGATAAQGIDDLRAIPWVFSWTQARIVLPAWYGLGTALAAAREEHGLELLREMERDWPFFAGAALQRRDGVREGRPRDRAALRRAVATTRAARRGSGARSRTSSSAPAPSCCSCRGEARLLDREPVLQASIDRRNPYVDPLSFVQVELLRRLRADGAGGRRRRSAGSAC